jgi:hypothetical protein
MEAMMPIIVTTISSSMRLKPALSERTIGDFAVILYWDFSPSYTASQRAGISSTADVEVSCQY